MPPASIRCRSTSTGPRARSARSTCRASTPSTTGCAPRPTCRRRRSRLSATFWPSPGPARRPPQPWTGTSLPVYEPLVAAGTEVVSIHLAGGISGTVESARQAAEQAGGRVEVMDSETGCGGLGLVALAAARAARDGASMEEVVAVAREARAGLKIWFAIDTLDYLQRGGRIGKAQAMLGAALKIKPILSLESEIVPVERVRTSGRAFERLVDYARSRKDDGAAGWVVQPAQPRERAHRLADRGAEVFGTNPVWVSEVGPVIGAHPGPGLVGVGAVPRSLLRGL